MLFLTDPEIVKDKILKDVNLLEIVKYNAVHMNKSGYYLDYDEVVLGGFINLLQKML